MRLGVYGLALTFVLLVLIGVLAWVADEQRALPYEIRVPHIPNDITIYDGSPISVRHIVLLLLVGCKEALKFQNYLVILISWTVSWFLLGGMARKIRDIIFGIIFQYAVMILYLSIVHVRITLYIPESIIPAFCAFFASTGMFLLLKKLRKYDFFEVLEKKLNIRVEPGYKYEIPVPFTCPNCNAVQYSNAQYCWKCGTDLTKFYNERAR